MNKTRKKNIFLAALLIVLYLLGLVFSVLTIISYPLSRQKSFHYTEAHEIIQKYLTSEEEIFNYWLDGMISGKMQFILYDTNGTCLLNKSSDPPFYVSHEADLEKVLNGEETYTLKFAKESFPTIHNLMGITGIPIIENGEITGAAFLIKKNIAITESIAGYAIYFSLLYWLAAFFIVSNIRKKKHLEQLQQNYIANVTHALKTPVASIKALSETLYDEVEPDPERQKLYYCMIIQEANRQDHMIRDILELSKLQSHAADLSKTTLYASEIFRPILEKYATMCDCMDITLHVSDNLYSLPALHTDEASMKQIMEILLDNAIKFVPDGGDIWVDATHSRKQTVFCVRDNGIGITEDALPHVFERFYKYSHDFNESGSGLGLAIAKEITSSLNEQIWVESEYGKGASFFFTSH